MKRRNVIIFLGVMVFSLISATNGIKKPTIEPSKKQSKNPSIGIQFIEDEWDEVLKIAEKEDKLIFLDLYSTACKPCRIMAQEVFTDSIAGTYFNQHFINVSYHFRNSPSGRYLKEKYTLNIYPTFYLIDQNESLIQSTSGIQTPEQLIEMGQKALELN